MRDSMVRLVLGATLLTVGCTESRDGSSSPSPACSPSTTPLSVDHVTLAVRDLAGAAAEAQNMGFRLKDGRLHANGIRNAHIKTDAGSLELLSVESDGTRPDAQSDEYVDFLEDGEGGAFLALGGMPVDSIAARLESVGVEFSIDRGAAWDYLTFPVGSRLRHVYFIEMHDPPADDISHMNGAQALTAVALDGGAELSTVLEAVGAGTCPQEGRLQLDGTVLQLVGGDESVARGRIRTVEFQVFTLGRPPVEFHGLTIGWSTPQ